MKTKLNEISDWIGSNTTKAVAERIAQLESDLAKTSRAMQAAIDAGVMALAENESLMELADCNPWYAGMMPNTYYCVYCRGSGRFTMNPKRDTGHGHKDDCPFLALLKGEQDA